MNGLFDCMARFQLINVTQPDILLRGKIEFREVLEDTGQVLMIIIGIVPSNIDSVHFQKAFIEIYDSKDDLG